MTVTAGLVGAAAEALGAVHGRTAQLLAAASSPPWYEVATTVATLLAALGAVGAIVVGVFTIRQRTESDARAQWWSRVQWAVDLCFEADRARRTVGFEALALLARSSLAGPGDLDFLRGLTLDTLAGVQARGEGPFALDDAAETVDRVTSQSHRTPVGRDEVAAARLRSATDAAQGVPTPAWIDGLAGTPGA